MTMILQVIFAASCFVEVISAISIPQSNNTCEPKLELWRLNKTLTKACGNITASQKTCGGIKRVVFFNLQEEMCSNCNIVFGKVSCALKNISHNCMNSDLTQLWNDTNVLSGGRNVTCNEGKQIMLKDFCSGLQYYVHRLLAKC